MLGWGWGWWTSLTVILRNHGNNAVGQMTHDTLAYHLFMMRTDGAEGYGWTLFFFKSFCTLACLGYCCCCMAIQPFQAVLLQVCVCVWVSVYALLRE